DQAGDLHRRLVRDDQGAFPELQRLTDLADRMQGIMADDDISGELHRLRLREGLRVHRRQCVSPKPRPRGILYLKATTSFAFALIREGHLRTFKTAPALSSAGWSFPSPSRSRRSRRRRIWPGARRNSCAGMRIATPASSRTPSSRTTVPPRSATRPRGC